MNSHKAMDLNSFRKGVKEGWFESSSAFQKHVMYGKLDTGDLDDSQSLRAACLYMHFGWLRTWKCSKRKASTMLQQGRSVTELLWVCVVVISQTFPEVCRSTSSAFSENWELDVLSALSCHDEEQHEDQNHRGRASWCPRSRSSEDLHLAAEIS